jgi:hypothetical protein
MKVGLHVDRSDGKGVFNFVGGKVEFNDVFGDLEINYYFSRRTLRVHRNCPVFLRDLMGYLGRYPVSSLNLFQLGN